MSFLAVMVMGVIYALSFTSLGEASNRREFFGFGQGGGQFQTLPDGAEFPVLEDFEHGSGQGQGYGQGSGQGQGHSRGQGFGQGQEQGNGSSGEYGVGQGLGLGQGKGANNGDVFSLEQGLPELGRNLLVITILIAVVYFWQYLAKRRQRISPAA
ncbi:MAG: hypothetical protein JW908_08560 [Anaerolineales bacterium]|nr:hypothetical protein [Anaerolineales bacterium]